MRIEVTQTPLKVLSFDIENRPLSYWYDGNCTAEITAIAASWHHSAIVHRWLLGDVEWKFPGCPNEWRKETCVEDILKGFLELYEEADIVTGHYIRKHDLPIINGALLEHGLPVLRPKLTSDTKLDLVRFGGIPASQEALGAMLDIAAPKVQMNQSKWRDANRLTRSGVSETEKRVVGDVIQHKALYRELVDKGYLKRPKVWRP